MSPVLLNVSDQLLFLESPCGIFPVGCTDKLTTTRAGYACVRVTDQLCVRKYA